MSVHFLTRGFFTHMLAPTVTAPSSKTFRTHEREKRRAYETRIRQVDGGSFTPLVFTTAGGAGPAASVFLKHLGSKIAEKKDAPYSQTIGWLRCRLSFALLRASILCIRGSRSLKQADPRSCRG